MNITIGKKKYTLAYTFNSFKYMEDFDLSKLQEMQSKPFMSLNVLSDLFYGALNYDRKNFVSRDETDELLEKYLEQEDADFVKLIEDLINMLTETAFFKNLQQK